MNDLLWVCLTNTPPILLAVLLSEGLRRRSHERAATAERDLARAQGELEAKNTHLAEVQARALTLNQQCINLTDRITQMQQQGMVWVDNQTEDQERSWSARDADQARMSR